MRLRHSESAFFTYQPVLYAAVMNSTGPILELGCGEGSTPLLHQLCKEQGRELITIDNNRKWYDKYRHEYSEKWHRFIFADNWLGVLTDDQLDLEWGVVFVDQSPLEARLMSMKLFSDSAKYIVLHDCDYFPENGVFGKCIKPIVDADNPGERDYGEMFTNWREFFPPKPWACRTGPPTLLASNTVPVDDLEIQW